MPLSDFHRRLIESLEERGSSVPRQDTGEPALSLDPHQADAVAEIIDSLRQDLRAFSIVHACGTGKTVLAATLVGAAQDAYRKAGNAGRMRDVLVGVDRANVGRLQEELSGLGFDVGIWGEGKRQLDRPVTVAGIHALQRSQRDLRRHLGEVGLLVGDEADCYLTEQRQEVVRDIGALLRVGLTATPTWPDGRDVEALWGLKISQLPFIDAIRRRLNVPPVWTAFRSRIDADALPVEDGDYRPKELVAATRQAELHLAIPEVYDLLVPEDGRAAALTLVYVPGAEMVGLTVASFRERYPGLTVHGWTGDGITAAARRRSEEEARADRVQVLVLCEMGGRALDLPNASVLIDAYPTLSPTKLGQRHPRVTRRLRGGEKPFATIVQIVPSSTRSRPVCLPDLLDGSAWEDAKHGRPLCAGDGDVGAPLLEQVARLREWLLQAKPTLSLEIIEELDLYKELSAGSSRLLRTWDERVAELEAWLAKHPGEWPSTRKPEDDAEGTLAHWVQSQRKALRDGKLMDGQRRKLEDLGVQPGKRWKTWDERVTELEAWRAEHPERWPSQVAAGREEVSLALWLSNQRAAFRDGKLTESQRQALEELGAQPAVRQKSFDEWIAVLATWLAEHPGTWPLETGSGAGETSLAAWVAHQRRALRDGDLTEDQRQRLAHLGVEPARKQNTFQ